MQEDLEDRLRPLWLGAKAGDEAAYRQAPTLVAGRSRAFFGHRLVGYSNDAEDLVQGTPLAAHLHRGTRDADMPVAAWLHGIALPAPIRI